MIGLICRFGQDESGGSAIEYGLMAGILALGIFASVLSLRDALSTLFDFIATTDTAAMAN